MLPLANWQRPPKFALLNLLPLTLGIERKLRHKLHQFITRPIVKDKYLLVIQSGLKPNNGYFYRHLTPYIESNYSYAENWILFSEL